MFTIPSIAIRSTDGWSDSHRPTYSVSAEPTTSLCLRFSMAAISFNFRIIPESTMKVARISLPVPCRTGGSIRHSRSVRDLCLLCRRWLLDLFHKTEFSLCHIFVGYIISMKQVYFITYKLVYFITRISVLSPRRQDPCSPWPRCSCCRSQRWNNGLPEPRQGLCTPVSWY